MDEANKTSVDTSTKRGEDSTEAEPQDTAASASLPASSMDSMEKLREAHRLRKARRGASRPEPTEEGNATSAPAVDQGAATTGDNSEEMKTLQEQLNTSRLEMASMRRNHMNNVKKIAEERDMFALQLAQEQKEADPESRRGIEELRNELKAVKMRNANLEEENVQLRSELKELRLRLTATRTLHAQQSGYEAVITDLIAVKLECANLNEEKETLTRENRSLKGNNDNLSNANGLLEKDRSEWVYKCAELEKKLRAMEESRTVGEKLPPAYVNPSISQNSDLQELAL